MPDSPILLENGSDVLLQDGDLLLLERGVEGIFRYSINDVVAVLEALPVTAVTDPRNARPGTVFVELPTFTVFTQHIADVTMTLRVLGAPPGNTDAANWILQIVDLIMDSDLAVIDGRPTMASIGQQDLPAYDLTIRLASRRI
ncbi:MAG: hypothetical protein ACO3VO_08975 [Ilumatobacteraceae bacterium]|jgi:hypothetical protein